MSEMKIIVVFANRLVKFTILTTAYSDWPHQCRDEPECIIRVLKSILEEGLVSHDPVKRAGAVRKVLRIKKHNNNGEWAGRSSSAALITTALAPPLTPCHTI